MATVLATFPEKPAHNEVVVWGDQQVRVRFVYMERPGAWYMSVFRLSQGAAPFGDPLLLGRRVSPRYILNLGLQPEGLPQDIIPVVEAPVGSDPYQRADLGESVRVLLLNDDEPIIPEEPAALDTLTVTLPSP